MNNNLFLIVDQVRGSIKNFIDANPNVPEKQIRKKMDQLTVQFAKINSVELTSTDKEEIIQTVAFQIVGSMEDASNIFNIENFIVFEPCSKTINTWLRWLATVLKKMANLGCQFEFLLNYYFLNREECVYKIKRYAKSPKF